MRCTKSRVKVISLVTELSYKKKIWEDGMHGIGRRAIMEGCNGKTRES